MDAQSRRTPRPRQAVRRLAAPVVWLLWCSAGTGDGGQRHHSGGLSMNPTELQDRIHKALNSAARAIGADTDAYRPSGVSEPLAPMNRFLRLRAAFTAEDGRFAHPNAYGDALWYGVFDAAYTRIGDYLVQQDAIWFVAAQQRLLPVLCVQTNRVVSFWRPAAPTNTGENAYGGVTTATNAPLLT